MVAQERNASSLRSSPSLRSGHITSGYVVRYRSPKPFAVDQEFFYAETVRRDF